MGAFGPQNYEDGRRESQVVAKANVRAGKIETAQVMERIPEHIVESSDQEELDQLRNDWLTG